MPSTIMLHIAAGTNYDLERYNSPDSVLIIACHGTTEEGRSLITHDQSFGNQINML